MAAPAKDRKKHVSEGTWRADRHAGRVDAAGVAGVEHDSSLWNLLEQWQETFDAAKQDVDARGIRIENAGGQEVPNPSCKTMKESSGEIRALCAILGIGPLNRARLGVGVDEDAAGDDADGLGLPARNVNHA